jgi:DNA polymerase
MRDKLEIIKDLQRAIGFYQELGFEYMPLKMGDIKALTGESPESVSISKGSAEMKKVALKEVRDEIGECKRCKLSRGRKNIVFGEGSSSAKLMFIGEGPGREEDIQARPFVGDAGKVLTNLIKKMGFKREDVYIANIVKCRPPMNRDPEYDEISTCGPFLHKQIEIINPRVIVCLGRVSSQTLLKTKTPISRLRGRFFNYISIPVMPTFHPAYLIRNPKDKWLTWEDAQKVLEKLK